MALETANPTRRGTNDATYYWELGPADTQYTGYLVNGISTWKDYVQAPDTGPVADTINGNDKNDRLYASIGDDTVDGGNDDDWVIGGSGNDTLSGGEGNDRIYGDYTNVPYDTIGSTDPWALPSVSDDSIVGDDVLDGGDGADTLIAGPGNDELHGGPRGDSFTDVLTGNDGADAFYLTYTPGDGGGGSSGTGFWSALLDEYAPGLGAKGAKAAVTKLATFAAKDFFETGIGSTLLGGVTTEVGSLAEKGIELLLGMDKSAPPAPTGADVMVITDFDPREDAILLPLPSSDDPAKSLSAVAANFGSTNSNGAANGQSGWGVRFDLQADENETTYAELLLSPEFLAEFGLDANSTGVGGFITDLFSNVIEIDDSGDPVNGGLVNPSLQYRFPTSPSAYSDGVLPDVVDTPLALQAPSGTYTKIYGAFGPQIVVAAATGTATTYIAGTNMGDIIFPGANGFVPEDWDNPKIIPQPTTPTITKGFAGDDILHGAAGQDNIDGGDGDDYIYGWNATSSPAVDQLSGGDGDDTLFAAKPVNGRAAAAFFGGDGTDTASFYYSRYGVTADLVAGVGSNAEDSGTGAYSFNAIENLEGTDYVDALTGNDEDNALQGHMGDDVIVAGAGDDLLTGGPFLPVMYRVAVGGSSIPVTDGGPDWAPDSSADPSEYLQPGTSQVTVPTARVLYDAADVDNAPEDLFARLRTDTTSMSWQFPVYASAEYTVRLYLAEGDQMVVAPNENVFEVSLEGSVPTEFKNIDPWVAGGSGNGGDGNEAFLLSADVSVDDNLLDVVFEPKTGAVSVYAIEIIYKTTDDDTLDGGDGVDTVSYAAEPGRAEVDLVSGTAQQYGNAAGSMADDVVATDRLANIENIIGTSFDDVLTGNDEDNYLQGNGGNNTLVGGGGFDIVSFLDGPQSVTVDMTTWSTSTPTLQANSFGGFDTISGFSGVVGGMGDDYINGDDRNNVLAGGAGEDTIAGGAGTDTVDFVDGTQGVEVDLWENVGGIRAGKWVDAFGDADTIDRATIEAYRGTSADDTMVGDGGSRFSALAQAIFSGEAGDDTLIGSGLEDQLEGGDDDDTLTGLAGNDTLDGGDGDDVINAAGIQTDLLSRINGGGPATDGWGADTASSPSPYLQPGATTLVSSTTATVIYDAAAVNGAPSVIFDLGRYSSGKMNWEIPLYGSGSYPDTAGGGSYTVNLYIVEGYHDFNAAGERVFDVSVEGVVPDEFDDIDPWVLGGSGNGGQGNKAFVLSYDAWVTDGSMSLEFISDVNNPIIYGIEVIQNATDDDTIDGGDGTDTVSYAAGPGKVEVDLSAGTAKQFDAAGAWTATDSLTAVENAVGTAFGDTIVGTAQNNVLTGFTGDDTIEGGGGFDTAGYAQRTVAIDAKLSAADAAGTFTVSLFDLDNPSTLIETDTLTDIKAVSGTLFDDSIAGSSDAETIMGDDGNDTLIGNGGADTLEGGAGNDTLFGGSNPILYRVNNGDNGVIPATDGGPDWGLDKQGDKSPYLGTGSDQTNGLGVKLYYTPGPVDGAPEALFDWYRFYRGTSSWDFPVSVAGYYAFSVYSMEQIPQGTQNDDTIFDVVLEGTKPPQFTPVNPWQLSGGNNGGLGHGVVKVTGEALVTDGSATAQIVQISTSGLTNVAATNAVQLVGYNIGDASADTLLGGDGNDTLYGYDGSDVLDGGNGTDIASYRYNHGKVVVDLSQGNGTTQEYGADGTTSADTVVSTDTLTDIEQIVGSGFDDTIVGDANDNMLEGGPGADILQGNAGTDRFVGTATDMAGDVILDLDGGETIEISGHLGDLGLMFLSVDQLRISLDADGDGSSEGSLLVQGDFSALEFDLLRVQPQPNETDIHVTLAPAYSSERITDGGAATTGEDFIYGSSEDDYLSGGGGDDVVDGNGGDDQLFGGSGDDVVRGDDGNDTIGAGSGDDWASGGRGGDTIRGGGGDDILIGGDGGDTLLGGSGDDILAPGAGKGNVATGGSGADIFAFGAELANGVRETHRITDYEFRVDALDLGDWEIERTRDTKSALVLWAGPDRDLIKVEGIHHAAQLTLVEDTLL